VETDDALRFCRADGTTLISYSGSIGAEAGTVKVDSARMSGEIETSILPHTSTTPEISRPTGPTNSLPAPQILNTTRELTKPKRRGVVFAAVGLVVIVIAATAYFYLSRNQEEALNYLEKHMSARAETANQYAIAPELDDLRSEPRFKAMLKRMNLPE
jgi:hypothetical protein